MARVDVKDMVDLTVGNSRLDLMLRTVVRVGRCDVAFSQMMHVVIAAVTNQPKYCRVLGLDQSMTGFFQKLATLTRGGGDDSELDYGLFYDWLVSLRSWYFGVLVSGVFTRDEFEKAITDERATQEVRGFAVGGFAKFCDIVHKLRFAYYPSNWRIALERETRMDDRKVTEDVSLEESAGYCYLKLVRRQYQEHVMQILGPDPRWFAFITVCWHLLKPNSELSDFALEKISESHWHVERDVCSETMACNVFSEVFLKDSPLFEALQSSHRIGAQRGFTDFEEALLNAKNMIPREINREASAVYVYVESEVPYGQTEMAMFPDGASSLRRYLDQQSISLIKSAWSTSARYLALTMAVKQCNDSCFKLKRMKELIEFTSALTLSADMKDKIRGCLVQVSESIISCNAQRRYWMKAMHDLASGFISLGETPVYYNDEEQTRYDSLLRHILRVVNPTSDVPTVTSKPEVKMRKMSTGSVNATIATTDTGLRDMSRQYKHVRTKDLPGFEMSQFMWFVLPNQERGLYRRQLLKKMSLVN